jgi:hypothetical protein
MRVLPLLALSGLVALSACDASQDITAPEVPEPQFHSYESGTPDGDYSMYYFDLNLTHNLWVKLAQTFPEGTHLTMCDGNILDSMVEPVEPFTTHNTDGDEVPFPGWSLPGADGFGGFLYRDGWRRTRGTLFVTGACWFDEWNDEAGDGGFPESAWVTGWAVMGLFNWKPFNLMLQSRGFPAQGHLIELDRAVLTVKGGPTLDLLGEIHHEDGTTLIQ